MYQYIVMLYDIYMILLHIYIYTLYIRVHLLFIPLFLSTSHAFQPWNIISISQAENGTPTVNRPDILHLFSVQELVDPWLHLPGQTDGSTSPAPLCFPDVSPPAVASPSALPFPPPERKLNVAASAAACCGLGEKSGDGQKWGKDGRCWTQFSCKKIVRNFQRTCLISIWNRGHPFWVFANLRTWKCTELRVFKTNEPELISSSL